PVPQKPRASREPLWVLSSQWPLVYNKRSVVGLTLMVLSPRSNFMDEKTSPKIASLAGTVLDDPSSTPETRSLAASALTQAPDKPKTGRDLYMEYREEKHFHPG